MKKQILVIEDDTTIKDLIVMHIESEFNVTILHAKDVVAGIEEIKTNQPVVIVCKYDLEERKGSDVYHYIKTMKIDLPIIYITKSYVAEDEKLRGFLTANKHNTYLRHPIKQEDFVRRISEIINLKIPSETENFRRIRGRSAGMFKRDGIPVFMMDNEEKYVEISDLSMMESDENAFAFVRLNDYKRMSEKINANIVRKLQHPGIDNKERFSLQFESVKKIHAGLRDLGMSEEEIKLGRAVYASSLNVISKNARMAKLLGGMVKYDQYVYRLSMMCNYLSIAMATKTSWHSAHSLKKLSMASIFQDIALQDDQLAIITSTKSEEYKNLAQSMRDKVHQHPFTCVNKLKDVKEVDDICSNVETIILNHHVRPDGSGFPDIKDMGSLSELARIFIIAHEFAHRLLSQKLTMDVLEQILEDFEQNFSKGKFRHAYTAFKDVFKRKNSLLARAKVA